MQAELEWLAETGSLALVAPRDGRLAPALARLGARRLELEALTAPAGPRALAGVLARQARAAAILRREVRDSGADLVVVSSATLPCALLAARLARVPALLYAGEILVAERGAGLGRAAGGRAALALARRLATAVIACSPAVARQYAGGGARVETIMPPLRGEYAGGDREGFRRRFGIGPNEPVLASLGNLTRARGQDVLVRAVAALRDRGAPVRCLIAGRPLARGADLAYERELRQLARRLGAEQAVVLAGEVDRVADLLAAADVIVNPARAEAFGRVAFEAGLAGRPVVSTGAGAIAELLVDGESALLVPPDDPAALAAAASRLLDAPELGARLAAGAARFAVDNLDGERALERFRGLVSLALDRGRAGAEPAASPPR